MSNFVILHLDCAVVWWNWETMMSALGYIILVLCLLSSKSCDFLVEVVAKLEIRCFIARGDVTLSNYIFSPLLIPAIRSTSRLRSVNSSDCIYMIQLIIWGTVLHCSLVVLVNMCSVFLRCLTRFAIQLSHRNSFQSDCSSCSSLGQF